MIKLSLANRQGSFIVENFIELFCPHSQRQKLTMEAYEAASSPGATSLLVVFT